MISSNIPIYLASKSPRRKELLKMIGISFRTIDIELDEKIRNSHSPIKNVKRLANEKCHLALEKIKEGIVISADTIVVVDGNIIGKPKNKSDAKKILERLSNRSHFVYTGFSLANKVNDKLINDYCKTKVFFKKLSPKEIKEYVDTGSPMDKAGAYGIQDDFGAVFVQKIIGSYYNVLGFPVSKIYDGLKKIL
jgi:nucleoside triphosphate pyrophosphatase